MKKAQYSLRVVLKPTFQFCFAKYLETEGFKVDVNTNLYEVKTNDNKGTHFTFRALRIQRTKYFDKKKFDYFHKIN